MSQHAERVHAHKKFIINPTSLEGIISSVANKILLLIILTND